MAIGTAHSSPRVAQLLAHPVRWAILGKLARSDRRVQELTTEVGAPQNLVSYHLALLRGAGLVGEHRSSSDRRDVYYCLDLATLRSGLDSLAADLHPVLGDRSRGFIDARGSVLFLCTGNSARSQIAEALLRHTTRGRVVALSAGIRPQAVHPAALKTLVGMGVVTGGLRSKHWSEVAKGSFDRVVSLCDIARDELPDEFLGRNHVHWSIPDPAAVEGPKRKREAAFAAAADVVRRRISELLASMSANAA